MLLTFVLFVFGLMAAALIGFFMARFSSAEDAFVRSMGGSLQVGGLAYVLHGLTRRGATHKVPISWRQLSSELRTLLGKTHRVSRSITVAVEAGSIGISGDAARLRVERSTLEGRVEELERLQQADHESIRSLESAAKTERAERITAIGQERSERQFAVHRIEEKIKSMEVGNIYLEWVGVLWIILGIVCATWAPELTP